MEHESARLQLSAWTLGQLDEDDARVVGDHVRGCDECTHLARFLEVLREVLREEAPDVLVEHPEAEDLARHATDVPDLALDARARIGAHLTACAVCRDAVEMTRTALRESPPDGFWRRAGRSVRRTQGVVLGVVAGAATVALLWWAMAPDPVVVHDVTLERTTRDARSLPAVRLGAETTHVDLEIPADPWTVRAAPDDFRLEIRVESDAGVWTGSTTARRAFDAERRRTVVRIPIDAFGTGGHAITLRAADDDATVYTGRFTVRRATRLP